MESTGQNLQLLEGKYLLKKKLGEGGMGTVYEAEHAIMGKRVAVKILHSDFKTNEEVIKRFIREARAAAAISHRNIIDVMDIGVTTTDEPFLVMEFLSGAPLDVLVSKKIMNLPSVCAVLEQTLNAIFAAHEKGVVHRDLKPENIFLNLPVGGDLEVKLIDFGISKFSDDNKVTKLTMEGTTLGTPAYMSPEQVRGLSDLNHLTDIYSVGIIFYEMLCQNTPFEGEQYSQVLANILMGEPRHPTLFVANFPPEAWKIIQKSISRDPKNRYQNAKELYSAISGLCTEQEKKRAFEELKQTVKVIMSSDAQEDLQKVEKEPIAVAGLLGDIAASNTAYAINGSVLPKQDADLSKSSEVIESGSENKTYNYGLIFHQASAFCKNTAGRISFFLMESPRKKIYRAGLAICFLSLLIIFISAISLSQTSSEISIKNNKATDSSEELADKDNKEKPDDEIELHENEIQIAMPQPEEKKANTKEDSEDKGSKEKVKKASAQTSSPAPNTDPAKSSSTSRDKKNPFRQLRNEIRKTFR